MEYHGEKMRITDEESFDKMHGDLNCIGKKPNDRVTSMIQVSDVIQEENSSSQDENDEDPDSDAPKSPCKSPVKKPKLRF